ncbi:unnamed protein product [Notodromas monacha]|uniref:Ig-like domain-containing protein n=1 Tax=Notodromas monacha TaxID=399045 RepID=A0A7R9GC30_9CRUS|nr:unnamed protein product [Notodromas monacha]CAG0915668.1 unnamed protein product [Notodromas monacha]
MRGGSRMVSVSCPIEDPSFPNEDDEGLQAPVAPPAGQVGPPRIVDHSWGDGAGPTMGGVFRQAPGTQIRLRCVSVGEPKPAVKWYKDGVEVSELLRDWRSKLETRWSLVVDNLKQSDAGVYTCRAVNKVGAVSVDFTLEVYDEMTGKPQMVDEHPMNTTVVSGETATLQCRVKSDSQPAIKGNSPECAFLRRLGDAYVIDNWLKRLETRSEENKYLNDSLPLRGERFRVLNTSSTSMLGPDTYLNRLVVSHARRDDAGLYVCLASNVLGYSFRQAFVTVEPSPLGSVTAEEETPSVGVNSAVGDRQMTSYLIGGMVVSVLLVVFIVLVSTFVARRKRSPGGGVVSSIRNGPPVLGPCAVGVDSAFADVGHKKPLDVQQHRHAQPPPPPFLHHVLQDRQPATAVLGLRDDYSQQRVGPLPSRNGDGFRYKLVPQQDPQLMYGRDSSSDVSSTHHYQKLPLGSSATPTGNGASRGTPDSSANCRHCGPPPVAPYHQQQHQQQQHHHHLQHRGFAPDGAPSVESCRSFVHFSAGMSHAV